MANSDPGIPPVAQDDIFDRLNRLTNALRDHDERGLALSLAAFAEEALSRLLAAYMRPGQAADALLSGFNAPLGTFSARIKASHALGLIDDEQFADLECLRKVRNEFAHSWEAIGLTDDRLSALIRKMSFSYLDDTYPETSADKLRSSCTALLVDITSLSQQIGINGAQAKLLGTRLIPGLAGNLSIQLTRAREALRALQMADLSSTERRRYHSRRAHLLGMQLAILWRTATPEMEPEIFGLIQGLAEMSLTEMPTAS